MNDYLAYFGNPAGAEKLGDDVLRFGCGTAALQKLGEPGRVYRDGNLSCIFSGFIYSYSDSTLPRSCPEEYILSAYRKYGDDMSSHFEGKFSAAVFDTEKNCAYFARDHFGGMPLYYSVGDSFILVSGKPSPIANCGLITKEISQTGLCDLFSLRYIPAPDTIFENIHALTAGHCLKASITGSRVEVEDRCCWDVDDRSENMIRDYDECKKLLREALLQSTEACIMPGKNGVFLSGGIDSTIVTGVASTLLGHRMDTFTIGFNEKAIDESDRAEIAAKAHNTDHHLYILDYDDIPGQLDTIISGFDQPFADASAIPTWIVNCYATRLGVENVLTGDGSDQIFAGSSKYSVDHYVNLLRKFPKPLRSAGKGIVYALPDTSGLSRKMRKVFDCAEMDIYEMRRRMLQLCLDDESVFALLKGSVVDKTSDSIAQYYALNRDITDELTNTLYVDLKVVADGGMMSKMGSMSRLAGVNTHIPMMSREMLELAFRIPPEFKHKGSSGKVILKEAFSDIIPPELLTASKKGFGAPVDKWFRGPLLSELKDALDPGRMEATGLFDPQFVTQLIDEHLSKSYDRSVPLFALYVFSKWYQKEFE